MRVKIDAKIAAQVVKIVDKNTNKISYLIFDEDKNEWEQLTKNDYNKIRGCSNGE